MIDIVSSETGKDLGIQNTQVMRAKNILAVQLGSLEYAQTVGIDLKYFLSDEFKFQNESFKAYLVEVLANQGINVAEVLQTKYALFEQFNFNLAPEESQGSLVAR